MLQEREHTASAVASAVCLRGHVLEAKPVAGSYVFRCKTCTRCHSELKSGTVRHSCKSCNYHLCTSCRDSAAEERLHEEIAITIYRAAKEGTFLEPGFQEDAWQVGLERGATIGQLRSRVEELYGVPRALQILRRDVDSPPLADAEPLGCDNDDVVHLSVAGAMDLLLGGPMTGSQLAAPLTDLAQQVAGAMQEAAGAMQEATAILESTTYNINFLLPERGPSKPEKRCKLEVAASAGVQEVLEMVMLELNVEDEALQLEFAGQVLPVVMPIQMVNIADGDTVMVVPRR